MKYLCKIIFAEHNEVMELLVRITVEGIMCHDETRTMPAQAWLGI